MNEGANATIREERRKENTARQTCKCIIRVVTVKCRLVYPINDVDISPPENVRLHSKLQTSSIQFSKYRNSTNTSVKNSRSFVAIRKHPSLWYLCLQPRRNTTARCHAKDAGKLTSTRNDGFYMHCRGN